MERRTVKTHDPKKGYEVKAGEVWNDEEVIFFIKEVERKRHYFRLVSGYGIQADVFEKLKKAKVSVIMIKEKDTGIVYVSSIEDWKEHQGKGNWGHGRQYVLSEKYMKSLEEKCINS